MLNDESTPEGEEPEGDSSEPARPLFRDAERSVHAERADVVSLALDAVARIDREIARAEARRAVVLDTARKVAEATACEVVLDAHTLPAARVEELAFRSFVAETAAVLRVPEQAARRQIEQARTLQEALPETREALAAGEISGQHARRIIEQSWSLPAEAVDEFEHRVVPAAKVQTVPAFSRTARRVRERLHPESIESRRVRAEEGRRVEFSPQQDGMAWVGVLHTADIAEAIYNATLDTARSLQGEGEERSLQQIAADVFADAAVAGFLNPNPESTTIEPAADTTADNAGETRSVVPVMDVHFASGELAITSLIPTKRRQPTVKVTGCSRRQRKAFRRQVRLGHQPEFADAVSNVRIRHTAKDEGATLPAGSARGRDPGAGRTSILEQFLPFAPESRDERPDDAPAEDASPPPDDVRAQLGVGDRRLAIRPTVMVTVPVLSLLGQSEEPATLEGYGPIDADTAAVLAANAPSFTRILTNPETGAVMSVGRDSYRVPADLKRALRVRDQTCRFPGCNRKAEYCDLDHTVDWQFGGETRIDNLAFLCRAHHRLKHETRWSVSQDAEGVMTWTSPSGNVHTTYPETRLTRTEPPPDYGDAAPF